MKSFMTAALVLGACLGAVLAAPSQSPASKEEEAFNACNLTNPVQRNPKTVITLGIAAGGVIQLSQEEKCNLYCFLQKVGFFDENGEIDGTGLVNYTLTESPLLAKYSDVIITQVFQIIRSTEGLQDKCAKADITFNQYLTNIFTLAIAEPLQYSTDVRGKIINAVSGRKELPADFEKHVKEYLTVIDATLKAVAKGTQNRRQTFSGTTGEPPIDSTLKAVAKGSQKYSGTTGEPPQM